MAVTLATVVQGHPGRFSTFSRVSGPLGRVFVPGCLLFLATEPFLRDQPVTRCCGRHIFASFPCEALPLLLVLFLSTTPSNNSPRFQGVGLSN